VAERAWRRPDKIHVKEARASLLSLRRESREPHSLSSRLLTLGDNLSETLASELGLAKNYALK